MVGGVIAGPLGAIAGGVAGALIGNASAEGKRPIGRTVDNIREVTEEPARKAYASISNAVSGKKKPAKTKTPDTRGSTQKTPSRKPATKKAPAKQAAAKKAPAKKTTQANKASTT